MGDETTNTKPDSKPKAEKKVKVQVKFYEDRKTKLKTGQPIFEGAFREPGEIFEVTESRAKALGNLVDIVG